MVAALMVIAVASPGVSFARPVRRAVVFMPRFTPLRGLGHVGSLHTCGRYVLVDTSLGQVVVIDDQTGLRRRLTKGCDATALGGALLATQCPGQTPGQESLIDLTTGQSTSFAISATLLSGCQTPANPGPCPWVSAIGSDWVAVTGHSGNYHMDYVTSYQNRATAKVVGAQTNPRLNVDLDTPGLITRVCSPLTVPGADDGLSYPGSLIALGHGFQIATREQVYLQRCGSHRRIHLYAFTDGHSTPTSGCLTPIYCPPATNAHSIIWELNNARTTRLQSIAGIFVPSLQRFTIKPPMTSPTSGPVAIALTNTHLYVRVGDKLYRASTPAATVHSEQQAPGRSTAPLTTRRA